MKKLAVSLFIVALGVLSSCTSTKRLTYLQDLENFKSYQQEEVPDLTVKRDDRLSILVSSKIPELALPFNLNAASAIHFDKNTGEATSSNSADFTGYRVNKEGCIDFPILGKLHVEGLTLDEVKHMIENKIIESNYIKEPLVNVELLNFQITILGDVSKTGNFQIKDNNLNLFEAIAMAGDLSLMAKRDEVLVIRTVDGERKVYPHNMLSKSVYDSPAFYLQQNDIIYVKPNRAKSDGNKERFFTILSTALSIVTAGCAVGYLILR